MYFKADQDAKIRKPRLSADEILRVSTKRSPDKEGSPKTPNTPKTPVAPKFPSKNQLTYSIEILAQLAMSPLCLTEPLEWERIVQEYPMLVRKVSTNFDSFCVSFKFYLKVFE